ncbi:MAG: YybH family protein [Candidatus Eiseniibacteriota bacterium]
MNQLKKTVAVCGLAVALLVCGGVASQASQTSEVAAIHAADDAWIKAYNTGQVENVVALYDPAATIYPPGAGSVMGRDAIHAFFTQDMSAFAKTGMTLALGDKPNGGVSGDMGWSSGTWILKDKTGQAVDSGWYFSVSKKADGKWFYVRDVWDSDKPAAPATSGGNDR